MRAPTRVQVARGATAPRGILAWSAVDLATSVARNKDRLRDQETRTEALTDLAWDAGESTVSGVARLGAGAGVSVYLAAAPAVAGAPGATALAVTAAPVLAGVAAGYAVTKAVKTAGRRLT